MSDRLNDDQVAWMADNPAKVSTWVNMLVEPLAREVQARRLSDITTPTCPTCNGEGVEFAGDEDDIGDACSANCGDGHIPPKVWVGILTDALRDIYELTIHLTNPNGCTERTASVLRLADSVTPKENE